jgi:hypothetical protein
MSENPSLPHVKSISDMNRVQEKTQIGTTVMVSVEVLLVWGSEGRVAKDGRSDQTIHSEMMRKATKDARHTIEPTTHWEKSAGE